MTSAEDAAEDAVPAVTVVIVNFRTPHLTESAARSALAQPETAHIVLVDNRSGDDSLELLRCEFASEPRVSMLQTDQNRGFGAGNNFGVRAASTPFVFFLNSDAILHPGALGALVAHWYAVERPGAIAPFVFCEDGRSLQTDAAGMFPTPMRLLSRRTLVGSECVRPDFVSGCAMLVDRGQFERLGGFDEHFFMYFEDVDLCKRLHDANLTIHRCSRAAVTHLGGRSYRRTGLQKADYSAAQDRLLRKHGASHAALQSVRLGRRLQQVIERRHN